MLRRGELIKVIEYINRNFGLKCRHNDEDI